MSRQRLFAQALAAPLLMTLGIPLSAWGQDCPSTAKVIVIEQLPYTHEGSNCVDGPINVTHYRSPTCLISSDSDSYPKVDVVYKLRLNEGNEVSFLLTPQATKDEEGHELKPAPDLVLALLTSCTDEKSCLSSSADFIGPDAEQIAAAKYRKGDYYLHIDSAVDECGDYALEVTGVNPLPDLRVGLAAPPSVVAGDNMAYTLTVSNAGQLDADDVRVTLFLPPNNVSVESAGGCEKSGKNVVCRVERLPIGASKDWSIVVHVDADADAGKPLESSANAIAQQGDPTPNHAEASTTVRTDVHLSLTLTAPAAVVAGRSLTYKLTVVNEGKSEAKNVTITTTLSDEVTIASASPGCDRNTGICKFPKLAPKGSISSVIAVVVKPSARGSLLSTAIARAEEFPSGSPAEWRTQVNPRANLHFTASTAEASVIAGNILTYNFTVKNAGPSTSTGASITDELPAGLKLEPSEGCTSKGNLVTCTLGTLNPGEDQSVMIKTLVDPALEETTLANLAIIAPNENDPVPENNKSDVINTVVTISADLQLTGEGPTTVSGDDLESLVCAGENLLYTFNVFNDGPSNSRGGTIRGIALGDLSFVSSPDGCIFHGNNGTVSCPVPAMPPKGEPYVARFVAASTKALTTVPVAARVFSAYDDESGNDEATLDSLSIDSASDLVVTLRGPSLVKPGSALTYTLDVTNQGPSKAEAVKIDFGIEPVIAPITVASEPGCDDTCTQSFCLCSIEADTTQRITISFTAPAELGTTFTTSASVEAATCDSPGNNKADVSTTVVENDGDLALTLRADRDVAVEGDLLRYTIDVVNQGFEIAPRVTVIDDLPAGVTFVKVEPVEGCSEDDGRVICEIEAGKSLTVTVRVNDGTTLENKAYLDGEPDLNEANNQDSLKTLVVKVAPLVLPFFEVSDPPSSLTTLFSVKNFSTSLKVRYTAFFGPNSLSTSSDLDDKQTKTLNLIDFGRLLGKSGYVGITPDPNSDDLRHTLTGDFVWLDSLHGSASGERLISTDTSRTPSELCTSWSVRFFRGEPAGASTDLLFFVPGNNGDSTEPVATGKVFTESGAFVQNIEVKSGEEAFRVSINTRKDSDLPSLLAGSGSIEWTFRNGLAGHVTASHRLRGKDEVAIPGFCRTSQTKGASSLVLPFFEKSAGITNRLAFRNETDEEIQVQADYFDETGASTQTQPPPTQLPAHATSIVNLDKAPELPESFRGFVKVTVVPLDNPAPPLGRALSGDYIRGDEHGEVSGSALVDADSPNQLCQVWDVRFVQGIPADSETRFLFYLQGSGTPTGTAYDEAGHSLGDVTIPNSPLPLESFLVPASAIIVKGSPLTGSGSVEWELGVKGHVAMLFTGKGSGGNYSVLIPGVCRDGATSNQPVP